jgi:hypothetical protein
VEQGLNKDEADRILGPQPTPAMVDLRRALVKFAWSRTDDQITWEDGAEALAATEGTGMAADYDHRLPLVEPSEQDLKIARLAVATAARTFSVSSGDPNVILVRECHVKFAVAVMRRSYDGALGYKAYSDYMGRKRLDVDAAKEAVVSFQRNVSATCRALLSIRRVNPNSISLVLAMDGNESREFIARLASHGAAVFDHDQAKNSSMVWTPSFMALLRGLERDPPPVKGTDLF